MRSGFWAIVTGKNWDEERLLGYEEVSLVHAGIVLSPVGWSFYVSEEGRRLSSDPTCSVGF